MFRRYNFFFWPYYSRMHTPTWPVPGPVEVPVGYIQFPNEIIRPPVSVAETMYKNIVRWDKAEVGGHFAALEQPKLLAESILNFFDENKKPVIIIGGGIMGTSIAKRFLNNDFEVHLFNRFSKSRFKFIAEEIKKNSSNFFLHENFNNLPWNESKFVIETVKEELVLKKYFKQIVNKVSNSTIIASNSSSFGISKISKNLSTQIDLLDVIFLCQQI